MLEVARGGGRQVGHTRRGVKAIESDEQLRAQPVDVVQDGGETPQLRALRLHAGRRVSRFSFLQFLDGRRFVEIGELDRVGARLRRIRGEEGEELLFGLSGFVLGVDEGRAEFGSLQLHHFTPVGICCRNIPAAVEGGLGGHEILRRGARLDEPGEFEFIVLVGNSLAEEPKLMQPRVSVLRPALRQVATLYFHGDVRGHARSSDHAVIAIAKPLLGVRHTDRLIRSEINEFVEPIVRWHQLEHLFFQTAHVGRKIRGVIARRFRERDCCPARLFPFAKRNLLIRDDVDILVLNVVLPVISRREQFPVLGDEEGLEILP